MAGYTTHHGTYLAHRITLEGRGEDAFAKSLSTARVETKPHQVDAALFALHSPLSKGVILADEVGLGKTIEASLVIAQSWAERRRRILLVVPASLRKQWQQELREKFSLPSRIMEARTWNEARKAGQPRPFDAAQEIILTSYEFAARRADDVQQVHWDLVVFDEAHRLRNVYKKAGSARAKALRDAVKDRFKILLTATPLQNSLMELYGLVSIIDQQFFGDERSFKTMYEGRQTDALALTALRRRMAPIYKRHLRRDVQEAGHVSFTRRMATTFDFEPSDREAELYEKVSTYLQRPDSIAFGLRPNQLVIIQARKILGSSVAAISGFLQTVLERLRRHQVADVSTVADVGDTEELAEELAETATLDGESADADGDGGADDEEAKAPEIDPEKLKTEIAELESYIALAREIGPNAKGEKMVARLPEVLDEVVRRNGQRKVVIFTESVRTQNYLAGLLSENGYGGQVVLLNGSNSDPGSQAIYKAWYEQHSLGQAMQDGFVKEPAVATRKDFRPDSVTAEQLERIKLEDGIHCHENVKAELEIYALSTGRAKVHPFMLVVAQDTTHAESLRQIIEAEDFFGGRYKGRVIRVDSATKGEESDEATARLLALETDTTTDVVIHVNKLKEGWDVRNLYTIVPLRASASDILTEQTLGRGLRLPYGARTGVEAVDTLTIIAHDRFDDVIRAARDPNSIVAIRKTVIVGEGGDVSPEGAQVLESHSLLETALTGKGLSEEAEPFVFDMPEERQAADFALRLIQDRYERELKKGINQLSEPEVQARITRDVEEAMAPSQAALDLGQKKPDIAAVVRQVTAKVVELTIEIPEIVVLPTREVTFGFHDFDLVGLETVAKQPISDDIMIQRLRDEARSYLARKTEAVREERVENYLVRHLVDFSEIDYDTQSELLFKLSEQMVGRLRSYLPSDEDVESVLLVHGKDLARFIFEQMKQHYWETPTDYRATVAKGFQLLRPQAFNVPNDRAIWDFRKPVVPAGDTRKHVFGSFSRCCYPYQRFDSNEEREFSVIIESANETDVIRWMKPGPGQFRIEYASGQSYEPDFVVETKTQKLIVEIKAKNEMEDPIVKAKARAASKWVSYANAHAAEIGGKPWAYALVPHDVVGPSATLAGLMARHGLTVAAVAEATPTVTSQMPSLSRTSTP